MKRFASYLYEPIIAVPASIAVLLLAHAELGLPHVTKAPVFYLIAIGIACALFRFLNGKERLLLFGFAAIVLLIPALYGLRGSASGYYSSHRYLWLLPLLGAGCDLCALLCRYVRAARYLTAAAVIGCLVFCLVKKYVLSQACVILFLTVLLLLFIDETQSLWRKSGHTDRALHLTFVAPFLTVWLILALAIPTGSRPYDWASFRYIWHQIQDFAVSLLQKTRSAGPDDMETYKAGFSDEAAPPGVDVQGNEETLLRVERSAGSAADSVYIAGQYCDTLDGLTWRAVVKDDAEECEFDLVETLSAFSGTEHVTDYIQAIELRITFRKFSSRFLLAPTKTIPNKELLARDGVEESGRNLVFTERKGINNEYVIGGYRMNRLHDIFREYMMDPTPITEESWALGLREYPEDRTDLTYERYLDYRARMKALYLHPVTLPEDIQAYVDAVTANAESPFDRMMFLAQDLAGFTYTMTPGSLPDDVTDGISFLSYLLETKQGYCSYFATAMTLLAWSEGLPARYVYGFLVPLEKFEATEVKGSMTHAWCEIYFENVGWIPFDATPGRTDSSFWTVFSERETTPWVPTPHGPEVTPRPKLITPTPAPASEEKSGPRILWFVLAGIGALALFALLILVLDRRRTQRRFRQMNSASRIPILYRRNTRLLAYLNLPIQEEETLAEYRERLLPLLPDEAVSWLTPYEVFLYGTARPADVAAAMQRGSDSLAEAFREESPQKYRLLRFINRI